MPYNSEIYKFVADEMVAESGADILFHTSITDVLMDGDKVRGIFVNNVDGPGLILGKVFVDCTGDATLAYLAGAEVMPWETDELQPMSICFKMSNIDYAQYDTMTDDYKLEMAEKG